MVVEERSSVSNPKNPRLLGMPLPSSNLIYGKFVQLIVWLGPHVSSQYPQNLQNPPCVSTLCSVPLISSDDDSVPAAIPLATVYGTLSSLYWILPWLVQVRGYPAMTTFISTMVLLALNLWAYIWTRRYPGYLPTGTHAPDVEGGCRFFCAFLFPFTPATALSQ